MVLSKLFASSFLIFWSTVAAAQDTKPQDSNAAQISIDNTANWKNYCIHESKLYSIGSKIQFSYSRPNNGLVAQEVLQCLEPKKDKPDAGPYWQAMIISCKDASTGKPEGCY